MRLPRRDAPLRILIVKLSSLGDIIHTTGCLSAVRAALPSAHVTMAVEERWADAVRHHPHVDALVLASPRDRVTVGYALEVRRLLARHGPFDMALDLQGNRRSALWTYLSGAPRRVGRGGMRPGWQLALSPDLTRHAVTVSADVCEAAGIAVADPSPVLYTGVAEDAALVQRLHDADLPLDGFVVINPFSRWPSKGIPLETTAGIIRELRSRTALPLLLSGGPDDAPQADALRAMLGEGDMVSLVGLLSLGEALCLYRRARLMVSCDSGPMHAAAALGTPVVALFGPTHPERTGPWGPGHAVIQAQRPAQHHAYRHDPEAVHMRAIDAVQVVEAVLAQLVHEPPKPVP